MKHKVESEQYTKLKSWIDQGASIAVWRNCDLSSSSIGSLSFTRVEPNGGTSPPHWNVGSEPIEHHATLDAFELVHWREVARVKVRRGPPYLGGIHRRDRSKLDTAMEKAGDGASWRASYDACAYGSPWFEAVIEVPETLATV